MGYALSALSVGDLLVLIGLSMRVRRHAGAAENVEAEVIPSFGPFVVLLVALNRGRWVFMTPFTDLRIPAPPAFDDAPIAWRAVGDHQVRRQFINGAQNPPI